MVFADRELARRLEAAEAAAQLEYAGCLAELRPSLGVAIATIAGGHAVFAGSQSPLTEAKGLGMDGPVTDDDLDRLARFFQDHRTIGRVTVCPLADPTLVEGLGRRGFHAAEFENFLYRPCDDAEDAPAEAPGVEVRPARPDEMGLYVDVVIPNFTGPDGVTPDLRDIGAAMVRMTGMTPFLGWVDGRPAGGGAVWIHRGTALLAGAGTLPPFRGRGLHAALTLARSAFARQAGCDLICQGAQPGSTSQRNAERRGLRLAYTRLILVREPDGG